MPSRLLFVPLSLISTQWPAFVCNVMQQRAARAEIHLESVDFAVVVVVGETGSARSGAHAQNRAGLARDISKLAAAESAEERVFLRIKWIRPPWKMRMSSQPSLSKS